MPPTDRHPTGGDPDDVDFVVGAVQQGPDEDLAQPATSAQQRRLRVRLGVGALVLVVTLLVVRVVTGTAGSSPIAGVPQSSSATSSGPSLAPLPSIALPTGPQTAPPLPINGKLGVLPAVPRLPRRTGNDPTRCPGLRCTSPTRALTRNVLDALQSSFPEAIIETAATVRLRGHGRALWFREIQARVGSEFLQLRVQAPSRGDRLRAGYRQQDGREISYLETRLSSWHIFVEVTDTTGGRADLVRLSQLASDPRILDV